MLRSVASAEMGSGGAQAGAGRWYIGGWQTWRIWTDLGPGPREHEVGMHVIDVNQHAACLLPVQQCMMSASSCLASCLMPQFVPTRASPQGFLLAALHI